MLALVLSVYHYHDKLDHLTLKDIVDPGYQEWFRSLANGVTGLSNSTGNMMKEMVLKGPSTFDSVLVYENVAIDFLKNAEGRWGELAVVYPSKNMWNENPYYILNVPWSADAERKGAKAFLDFLLSEPIQRQAILHGFRPANPAVSLKGKDSPFLNYGNYGVKLDLPSVRAPPKAEVITNLLTGWKRTR